MFFYFFFKFMKNTIQFNHSNLAKGNYPLENSPFSYLKYK